MSLSHLSFQGILLYTLYNPQKLTGGNPKLAFALQRRIRCFIIERKPDFRGMNAMGLFDKISGPIFLKEDSEAERQLSALEAMKESAAGDGCD